MDIITEAMSMRFSSERGDDVVNRTWGDAVMRYAHDMKEPQSAVGVGLSIIRPHAIGGSKTLPRNPRRM